MRDVVSICDSTQLGPRKMIRLSHWLVTERNETRQLTLSGDDEKKCFLGERGEAILLPESVRNDDCLHTEMAEAQKHLTDADRRLKNGDREGAKKAARQARKKVDEAIADIETPA